jgi:hypothetical protein
VDPPFAEAKLAPHFSENNKKKSKHQLISMLAESTT